MPYDYAREIADARAHQDEHDRDDDHLTAADFAGEIEGPQDCETCANCGNEIDEGEAHQCPPPCLPIGMRVNLIRANLAPGKWQECLPEFIFWNVGTVEESDPAGAVVRWWKGEAGHYDGSFYFPKKALEAIQPCN